MEKVQSPKATGKYEIILRHSPATIKNAIVMAASRKEAIDQFVALNVKKFKENISRVRAAKPKDVRKHVVDIQKAENQLSAWEEFSTKLYGDGTAPSPYGPTQDFDLQVNEIKKFKVKKVTPFGEIEEEIESTSLEVAALRAVRKDNKRLRASMVAPNGKLHAKVGDGVIDESLEVSLA